MKKLKADTMSGALALKLIKTKLTMVFSIIKGNGQAEIFQAKINFTKDTQLQPLGTCSSNKFMDMRKSARLSMPACLVHRVEALKPSYS